MDDRNKALTEDEIHSILLSITIIIVFLSVVGCITLLYQVHRFKKRRTQHSTTVNAANAPLYAQQKKLLRRYRSNLEELKKTSTEYRKKMQLKLVAESIEALRSFQGESSLQLGLIKKASFTLHEKDRGRCRGESQVNQ